MGTGTGASCTESALNGCLPGGGSFDGTVTFNCAGAATITVTSTKTISAGLANNGGPTQTIAIQAGSPAINAGDESVCSVAPVNGLDQRSFVRPGPGAANCSIGAYEFNSPGPPCVGDCSSDRHVTVDELLTMVNIALGNTSVTTCKVGDANHDGYITVDEILVAVNNALTGCPAI